MAAPTSSGERIHILDSLRGIAVLGILLMNIPGFALPRVAIFIPNLIDFSGPNYFAWYGVSWFLEGSQRALFSMLFGAGSILFISRLEARTPGLLPAELLVRRQLWLLVFGLFNAYILLWFWDILFHYAIFGILLFPFRRLRARHLFFAAAACLVLQTVRENVDFYRDKQMIARGEAVAAIDTTKTALTPVQKERLEEYVEFRERFSTTGLQTAMEKNLREVRGNYASLYDNHSRASMRGETEAVFHFLFFDVLLFMFLGMAFFKNGVLTGEKPAGVYAALLIGGLGIGLLLSYFRLQPELRYNFDRLAYTKYNSFEFYELSRTFRAIGIFGGIMLLYKWRAFDWLFRLMRPVGQMAFTNYLMQSVVCGLIFYGVGFGLFGKLQLHQIYYVVAAVWALEIIWSHLWLRYFRFGPLEWVWRSLTYWKKQPIRKKARLPEKHKTPEPEMA